MAWDSAASFGGELPVLVGSRLKVTPRDGQMVMDGWTEAMEVNEAGTDTD